MIIREYTQNDCIAIAKLFYTTVHSVCAGDYTKAQLNAWADGSTDLTAWNKSLSAHYTLVALEGERVIGFGDIDPASGYLDRLYVHKSYQRSGVATAICERLESKAETKRITTHASITAKPFFESRGYIAVKRQEVLRKGVRLTNFVMEKKLG